LQIQGFKELVQQSWSKPIRGVNSSRTLHIKLARLPKSLRLWNKQRMASMRQEAFDVDQTILRLDQLQEQRVLTESEMAERQTAKGRIIGLAAVRRIKLRQRSRLTVITQADKADALHHHFTSHSDTRWLGRQR
jgi:hypothetical protein